jgi:hypothetical protein
MVMSSLVKHFWPCIEVISESVNSRKKMEYGELADRLGLKLAKQEWSALLDLVAAKTKREVDYDLTWNVVYATGPAKGLGRYFSNGNKTPGSTLLDPKNQKQVADYERTLQEMYEYTYALKKIEGKDTLIKLPRVIEMNSGSSP